MNKTYIKRELTLSELGIPINEDIQEYIDLFNEIIGDIDELIKKHDEYIYRKGYMYLINETKLLFYDIKNEQFYVDYDNIWKKFEEIIAPNCYSEISELLTCMLGEAFKFRVTTTDIGVL